MLSEPVTCGVTRGGSPRWARHIQSWPCGLVTRYHGRDSASREVIPRRRWPRQARRQALPGPLGQPVSRSGSDNRRDNDKGRSRPGRDRLDPERSVRHRGGSRKSLPSLLVASWVGVGWWPLTCRDPPFQKFLCVQANCGHQSFSAAGGLFPAAAVALTLVTCGSRDGVHLPDTLVEPGNSEPSVRGGHPHCWKMFGGARVSPVPARPSGVSRACNLSAAPAQLRGPLHRSWNIVGPSVHKVTEAQGRWGVLA